MYGKGSNGTDNLHASVKSTSAHRTVREWARGGVVLYRGICIVAGSHLLPILRKEKKVPKKRKEPIIYIGNAILYFVSKCLQNVLTNADSANKC